MDTVEKRVLFLVWTLDGSRKQYLYDVKRHLYTWLSVW